MAGAGARGPLWKVKWRRAPPGNTGTTATQEAGTTTSAKGGRIGAGRLPRAAYAAGLLTDTFRILDLCGVLLLNGILGGLIARRKNFDLVGFVVLAMLTATAGGILRDVMIQAGPPSP